MTGYRLSVPAALAVALLAALVPAGAEEAREEAQKEGPPRGLRVFSCGHSFHFFVPQLLEAVAREAGIKGHQTAGLSAIGGSRVIQHWEVADEKNKAKKLLGKGEVDVLTLSPIYLPDDGIGKFVELALKHNKDARVTVQANWLPFDTYDKTFKKRPKTVDHDAPTAAELRKLHEPYFKEIDDHVRELNRAHKKDAVFVVPVGQAVIALREKIIDGKAPTLKKQSDLFSDAIGHARPALAALNTYCHYAVLYRRSPVGLRLPAMFTKTKPPVDEKLNTLLQELAWEAVAAHPLSGVKAAPKAKQNGK